MCVARVVGVATRERPREAREYDMCFLCGGRQKRADMTIRSDPPCLRVEATFFFFFFFFSFLFFFFSFLFFFPCCCWLCNGEPTLPPIPQGHPHLQTANCRISHKIINAPRPLYIPPPQVLFVAITYHFGKSSSPGLCCCGCSSVGVCLRFCPSTLPSWALLSHLQTPTICTFFFRVFGSPRCCLLLLLLLLVVPLLSNTHPPLPRVTFDTH